MSKDPYIELFESILPSEFSDNFELQSVSRGVTGNQSEIHLYLDEKNNPPKSDVELFPNGFYAESVVTDFPIRDRKTFLHIRRRRWKDAEGNSYSNDWPFAATGTRHSKEFADFLKGAFGR